MRIHQNFIGGNITVMSKDGQDVYVERELRDTTTDWFYWAFAVEGAAGETLTFHFAPDRLGYWGPAVSHDLQKWNWLGQKNGDSFTYHFAEDENLVYFAHHMLYHPGRFLRFAADNGLKVETLCTSRRGRDVPFVRIGTGERKIILTSRHHACESTGTYVLEGALRELARKPIENSEVFCVPFVDYDGVVDGDQGKNRAPHDQNRDYVRDQPAIYAEVAAIRDYAEKHGCTFGIDFHSPWHIGGVNDKGFIPQNTYEKLARLEAFGRALESNLRPGAFRYQKKYDVAPDYDWNKQDHPTCGRYLILLPGNDLAFSLETAYFGEEGNVISEEGMLKLGESVADTIRAFME